MGVNRIAGTLGCTMEPPAATEYAVLPVGVASITPSACTCTNASYVKVLSHSLIKRTLRDKQHMRAIVAGPAISANSISGCSAKASGALRWSSIVLNDHLQDARPCGRSV